MLYCEEIESFFYVLKYVFDYVFLRKLQFEIFRFSLIYVKVDGKDFFFKGM